MLPSYEYWDVSTKKWHCTIAAHGETIATAASALQYGPPLAALDPPAGGWQRVDVR